jgi:polar amino acid transport system substrate-binding protein
MRRKLVGLLAVGILLVGLGALGADKYIVSSDIPWPPFEMVTTQVSGPAQYFGFDIDLMRAIAIIAGYEIDIQNMAFDSIIPAVKVGKSDIGASGFTITAEREKAVDFSNPYWLSNQAVIVRAKSGFKSLDDVFCCGHKIGAQRGTTGADWVQSNLVDKGADVKLLQYETYPLAILDLVSGRLDAVVQDEPASQQSLQAYPGQLTIAGIIETNEYFGFAVAEGDPNGLLAKINDGMLALGLRWDLMRPAEGQWKVKLRIVPGSPWDNLVRAYFSGSPEVIEKAYLACKDKLLGAKDMADIAEYASCLADKVAELSK